MKEKYGDKGFMVVSIHAPEFSHEKERSRVVATAKRFNLTQPIMMDNDHDYWRALGNRYWPSFYLVDKQGRVVHRAQGELHEGQASGRNMEGRIQELLRAS